MSTPIPIIIRGREIQKPLEKCPKCQHEWYKPDEDEDDKPMTLGQKLFLWSLWLIVISMFLWMIDFMVLDNRFTNHLYYTEDCDYEAPRKWKIVSNGKMYAVQDTGDPDWIKYLKDGGHGIDTYTDEASLFFNECKARAFLKDYLDQQKPKITGFE